MIKLRFIILIVISLFLLNACTGGHRKDGPPPYPVDVSRIPDAVPKVEKRSRFGNYSSYVVFGKRYYVMRTSKNYQEVGVASWYGTMFHKQRTSSGEPYDMLAMTAAHKTLPLPTYAQVTNLKNHRSVIVKINDRGPFEGNRILDLSYVAAKKLGMTGHGTGLVKIKAIDPVLYAHQHDPNYHYYAQHSKQSVPVFVASNNHQVIYLQVGVFRNRLNAERLKNHVSNVVTIPVHIALQQQLYRVQVGPILDNVNAIRVSNQLKRRGIHVTKIT